VSAQWALFAAQAGVNLLSARSSGAAAGQAIGQQIGAARIEGTMERIQLERQARLDASLRTERFSQAMGSQRAALGAAGVSGGRTARMLETQSRLRYQRAQGEADFTTMMQTRASEFRQQQRVRGLRQAGRQAGRQAALDLLGSGLSMGQTGMDIYQAQQAGG
jgi:hypothetical protein